MDTNKIISQYFFYKENEKNILNNFNSPDFSQENMCFSLVFSSILFATHDIFVKHDFKKAKIEFYQAGLLKIFLHEKFDQQNYTSSNIFLVATGFTFCILSDSQKLINQYLKYTDDFLDTFSSSFAKAIQACVKGDDTSLQEQIENLERHTNKKSIAKNYAGVPTAFKGILQKDKSLIEDGINEILAKHNKQEQPAVVKDYMNLEALTLAKLAFRKGIVVEIDNPLLPKEMIPTQEIEGYKSYDFLKDLEATL